MQRAVAVKGKVVRDIHQRRDGAQPDGAQLILPGFVDAHAHYPQTAIIASWGKRLIDWLNTYTFPEEMRFGDPGHAAERLRVFGGPVVKHQPAAAARQQDRPRAVTHLPGEERVELVINRASGGTAIGFTHIDAGDRDAVREELRRRAEEDEN